MIGIFREIAAFDDCIRRWQNQSNLWLEYFQYIYRFTKYRYMKENALQEFLRFGSSIWLDIFAKFFRKFIFFISKE